MSVIRVDNFGPSAGGTTYSARGVAKAWVNFNGTGTIAARDSENVSSLADNGTGDYTISFSNAFNSGNYAPTGVSWSDGATGYLLYGKASVNPTASASRFSTSDNSAFGDSPIIGISFHGDLA